MSNKNLPGALHGDKSLLFAEFTWALDPEMFFEVLCAMMELAREEGIIFVMPPEQGFGRKLADMMAFRDGGEI